MKPAPWQTLALLAVILIVSIGIVLVSQRPIEQPGDAIKAITMITWDPPNRILTVTVKQGRVVNDQFIPGRSKQDYVLHFDENNPVIQLGKERRKFDPAEVRKMRVLFDALEQYGVENYYWWQQGEGKPSK